MKLRMVSFAERERQPCNVVATTGMVVLDMFVFATNDAHWILADGRFHDRDPMAR